MSSDETSDDSGFDKEAEREKLREKYEADQEGRENTRRMSELLLQGATMTGKHCNQCGDPIFRYDGQEFCPTCQQAAQGEAAQGGATEGDAAEGGAVERGAAEDGAVEGEATRSPGTADGSAADQPTADGSATDQPTADRSDADRPTAGQSADASREADAPHEADESGASAPDSSDDEPRVEIEGVRVADRHVDRSDLRQPPSKRGGGEDRRSAEPSGGRARGGRERASDDQGHSHARDDQGHGHAHDAHQGRGRAPNERASAAGDLATARESLVRTLTDLARRAEETDDAGRARELLAATREAAEALAALDRANH